MEPNKPRVLVIGGYGVFGGRLSRRLASHSEIEVIVAGRSIERASAHCKEYGGTPQQLDLVDDIEAEFQTLKPTVVVDAAGPFQHYGRNPYRVAQAAIASGAHYLDLADDADFVAGISALNSQAVSANVVVRSGCSSVPAISAAAAAALSAGMASIETIESAIMPGNRAPRGTSVVNAILAQVGRPVRVWQANEWSTSFGWCQVAACVPKANGVTLGRRLISPIGAPDLKLFPKRFGARTVRFRAGLELWIMHLGLVLIGWVVRLTSYRGAPKFTPALLWVANILKPFGSDRGGMTVDVLGRTPDGLVERRRWTLIAEAGDGPAIPATPAYLLAMLLCQNSVTPAPGAEPCVEDLTIDEIEAGLAAFSIDCERTSEPLHTVFETALSSEIKQLPKPIQQLHDVLDVSAFRGTSDVERGTGSLSRIIGWCLGFPPAGENVPVRVDMRRDARGETWIRQFGERRFRSHLSCREGAPSGEVWERFGPLHFLIKLTRVGDELHFPVRAARLLGVLPLPRNLLPTSDAREYVDEEGNACFDVAISHPMAGFIVRYQGWLKPIADAPA